jgi:Domain of unknown function (DUF4187)/G-patch domain
MPPSSTEPPDADDDYLTMTFDDPKPSTKIETLTEKKKRLAHEAEVKGRPRSKAELVAEEKSKREAALYNDAIDTNSKGFKMMAALGYKPGTALGATRPSEQSGQADTRLLEPVGLELKEGRSGIGADAEKKRKFREEVAAKEEDLKKRKIDEGEFRERQQKEREDNRTEGQMFGAMKVCEGLEEQDETASEQSPTSKKHKKPLSSIHVLWRGLVKQRALQERDRRMRYDLHQSLSRRPTYDDPDEDRDDKIAMGKKPELEEEDLELDLEDEELDAFAGLDVADRLQKLVSYLREEWNYCFWCKYRYPDASMEGCPGTTEEDHD